MPTVFTFPASSCPAIQLALPIASFAVAAASSNGSAPSSPHFTAGMTSQAVSALNVLAERVDAMAKMGGGAIYALASPNDFVLSPGAGLTINIGTGTAGIEGLQQMVAYTGLAINDNATNYIWIGQANPGSNPSCLPFSRPGVLTPPSDVYAAVYIGCVVTSGGAITKIDCSGVFYADGGGFRYRKTADAGAPTDTIPANTPTFLTHSGVDGVGTFVWNPLKLIQEQFSAPSSLPILVQNVDPITGANVGGELSGAYIKPQGFEATLDGLGGILIAPVGAVDPTGGG